MKLAAAPGFEPEIRESKSRVLPVTPHCYFQLVVEGGLKPPTPIL